tara:strand:+ start:878 stop:1066 length:189 start_codon:yes stop_codon:yes gene_type:complete
MHNTLDLLLSENSLLFANNLRATNPAELDLDTNIPLFDNNLVPNSASRSVIVTNAFAVFDKE